ncbi:hypothetical protein KKH42_02520 [bacterium]|nr:hypothetical protein [bacterium]
MSYKYKEIKEILSQLNISRIPFIGPALCDKAEGDENYDIPADLNRYYIPVYKKYLSSIENEEYPFFFGELQPETEWVNFNGEINKQNPWYKYYLKPDKNIHFGLHLSIKPARVGSTDEKEIEYTLNNRYHEIDFGERIGVKYYVLHISQDNFIGTDANYKAAVFVLKKTIEYLAAKKTSAYVLIENIEYPKYPSTPQELCWWVNKIKEFEGSDKLSFGVMLDVAHLWKSRGDIIRTIKEGNIGRLPDWIKEEKDIIFQPFHDLLNYTLKTRLSEIPVIGFHIGGCYGVETHLIPGMRVDDDPELTDISIRRFYDENIEMNLKTTIKNIVQYYFDSFRNYPSLNKTVHRPLYIVTESYISKQHSEKHSLRYPNVLKGVKAIRDYLVQYMEKLDYKSRARARVYEYFKKR